MSTQTKHTPGPWYVGDSIRSSDTVGICAEWEDGAESGETTIAEVLPGPDGVAQADARLIAAAPELLEGMKELLECFREACANPETNMAAARTIAVAEQRIAKAEGRA